MKPYLPFLLFFLPIFVFAQNKKDIFYNFEYTIGSGKMEMMNHFLADTGYFNGSKYSTPPTNTLSKTHGFELEIGYQPFHFQDFSFGFSYSFCDIHRTPSITIEDPVYPGQFVSYFGHYQLKLSRFHFLMGSQTHFDKLFHFDENTSQFMQRLKLAGVYQIGLGKVQFLQEEYFQDPFAFNLPLLGNAINLNGQLACLLGYQLNKGTIVNSIGLKLGYNFNFSKNLKDAADRELIYYQGLAPVPMKLDFSGWFIGLSFAVAK